MKTELGILKTSKAGSVKQMKRVIATGVQDFEKIRINNYFYVDKTDFIREWWNGHDDQFRFILLMNLLLALFRRTDEEGRLCQFIPGRGTGTMFERVQSLLWTVQDSLSRFSFVCYRDGKTAKHKNIGGLQ